MKNTYINDNMLSAYPFLPGVALPFPASCVSGIGVCLHGVTAATSVRVSSIELSIGRVRAVFCLSDGTRICSLNARVGGPASVFHGKVGDLDVNCWMTAGMIPASCVGSYHGDFKVDPSCVQAMPSSVYGVNDVVKVNGVGYSTGVVLSMSFEGFVKCALSRGASLNTAYVRAEVPYGAVVNVDDTITLREYKQVTSINGHNPSSGLLYIDFKRADGSSIGVGEYVKCSLINAVLTEFVETDPNAENPDLDPQDYGPRLKIWCNLNDTHGDSLFLIIHGTEKFPNCYTPGKDQAAAWYANT